MSKKTIKLSIDRKGRYEMWQLNRKGFYNFIKYLTKEEYEKEKKKIERTEK